MTKPEFDRTAALAFADKTRAEYERQLKTLVEIPTVSSQREHRPDILRGVDAAVAVIESVGGTAEVLRPAGGASGNPIVYGRLGRDAGVPTVTVYNHMDVQPADRGKDGWSTDPFVCTIDGDTYRGRGTTDDKGPALAALYGAAFARERGAKINAGFLWEFEEEIGSPTFETTIGAHRAELATGSVVVSDTIWVSRERPASCAGLRGMQGFLLRLRTGARDEHSGVTGGAARNPLAELMQLVSECVDGRTGEVKIPGFYADVVPPTPRELEDFAQCGFTIERFQQDHQFRSIRPGTALEVMQRIWARPTFEVHGVVGGYAGEGIKTVVPPFAEVKVSCRLVPNMTTHGTLERVRAFVASRNPDVEVVAQHGLEPYRGHTTGPLADAISGAIEFGFGRRPVFVREGGSIGAVVSMERVLGVPVMFLGLSLPEHGYHAPNENFDWPQARGGIAAFADYFRRNAAG